MPLSRSALPPYCLEGSLVIMRLPFQKRRYLPPAGAAVDPIDHFKTQLPYALCNGGLCLLGLWIAAASQWQGVLLGVLSMQLAVLLTARWLWRRKAQVST